MTQRTDGLYPAKVNSLEYRYRSRTPGTEMAFLVENPGGGVSGQTGTSLPCSGKLPRERPPRCFWSGFDGRGVGACRGTVGIAGAISKMGGKPGSGFPWIVLSTACF